MLSDGPASGYDLKKQFESSFAHFFAAGYGSIYPALSTLAKDGLVSCEEIPQEGKPDRKVYRITEDGHDALLSALADPTPSHKVRSEFLAMMCFAHLMTAEQIDTVVDNRLGDIECYKQLFAELEASCDEHWTPGHHFVLGFGRTIAETMKKYIETNRHMLVENSKPEKKKATG
jgi:DNA-binding PadR family transcriptional regulator